MLPGNMLPERYKRKKHGNMEFLNALGHRISSVSDKDREASFFQRISVTIQCFNSALCMILLLTMI